jgi:hypothetical protein
MEQPVIVVAGESPPDDAGTAFAAGVAAATAAEATVDAHQAEATAEAAEERAAAAVSIAAAAESAATRAEAGQLGFDARLDRMEAMLDNLVGQLQGGAAPGDEDPTVPPRVSVTVEPGTENGGDDQGDKPERRERKAKTFGSSRWFTRS